MRRFLLPLLAPAAVLLASGCGQPPTDFEPFDTGAFVVTSAEVDTERPELVLRFHNDFTATPSSELVTGTNLRVAYDEARLPQCRGEFLGKPGWNITGYWKLGEDGPVSSFEAGGFSPSGGSAQPLLPLNSPGELQLWFQISSRWGCTAWDSNFGENWRFTVRGGD